MLRPLIICATAFAATLSVLVLTRTEGERAESAPAPARRAAASTDGRIAALQAALARRPDAVRYATLSTVYLRKVRETGDPAFYARAEEAAAASLRLAPDGVDGLIASASLALSRHEFPRALRLAQHARRAAPEVLRSYTVLVDALVETGRLARAERALQRLLDRKPGSGGYARASYLRELRGDLPGAAYAMRLAVSAGGETPEEAATLRTLLGDLELLRGRVASARRLYREALSRFPGHPGATFGLARVSPLDERLRILRGLVDRLPLPEYAIALGDAQRVAGDAAAARESFALVEAERRLLARAGVQTDELAAFEVDRGRPRRALRMARRASANARALDGRGWALTHLGRPCAGLRSAHRALALAAADPGFRYHAGIAALRCGHPGEARRDLRAALRGPERLGLVYARDARRVLRGGRS